ncbi:MAG: hypothetical protein FJ146_12985 [Deltaproteobacteria bacterium]|nr:hypothetical protein [Deltaproteobacteria bacterium]
MLREGVDFYWNEDGLMVLTAHYLLARGHCCKNGCRHCPYGFIKGATPPEQACEKVEPHRRSKNS